MMKRIIYVEVEGQSEEFIPKFLSWVDHHKIYAVLSVEATRKHNDHGGQLVCWAFVVESMDEAMSIRQCWKCHYAIISSDNFQDTDKQDTDKIGQQQSIY